MSISDIGMLFQFIGGVGMFLYGMNIMADGMQKSAGSRMSHLLGVLTSNRLMAVCVGALVTAIIQSSGATTVMVVGLVNAGILSLSQAVGVIMGANIGTTITAWIVSMSQLGDAVSIFQPAFIAPFIIGIGAFIFLFSKTQKKKVAGEICVGIGLLFIGLDFMSSAVSPYTDAPIFAKAFTALGSNPLLGMLVGVAVTALLQSSSASVGILQTLAMNGVVTANAAVYITLGQNIGSCVTALISSAGANKTAKRAAVVHLSFNLIGALLFGGVIFIYFTFFNRAMAVSNINSVEISIFHTIFNISNTVLLFPFANQLVKLSGVFIHDGGEQPQIPITAESEDLTLLEEDINRHLDKRILESPSFAVETVSQEVVNMGEIALGNAKRAVGAVFSGDRDEIERVFETEAMIDKINTVLTGFLVKVSNLSLNEQQNGVINNLFYTINDMERIGDHSENIGELAQYIVEHNIHFTDTALKDLRDISDAVIQSVENAVESRKTMKMEYVRKVIQYEDEVDNMEEELREKHIERLSQNECSPSSGVVFLDLISNLERVSDHAYNIAGYVKDEM